MGRKYSANETNQCVAKMADETSKRIKEIMTAMTDFIGESLRIGDEVRVKGLGTFKAVERAARVGRNPKTGEPVEIPARKVIKFVPATALNDVVAGK